MAACCAPLADSPASPPRLRLRLRPGPAGPTAEAEAAVAQPAGRGPEAGALSAGVVAGLRPGGGGGEGEDDPDAPGNYDGAEPCAEDSFFSSPFFDEGLLRDAEGELAARDLDLAALLATELRGGEAAVAAARARGGEGAHSARLALPQLAVLGGEARHTPAAAAAMGGWGAAAAGSGFVSPAFSPSPVRALFGGGARGLGGGGAELDVIDLVTPP
jgi:hypothetical protein